MTKHLGLLVFLAALSGPASVSLAAPVSGDTSWKSQVSKAILEGRCDEAKSIALQANDLDVAEQALRLCKPSVTPVPPIDSNAYAPIKPTETSIKEKLQRANAGYALENFGAAFPIYSELSNLGNLEARLQLGYMYFLGQGVSKNEVKAFELIKTVAVSGNNNAQYSLGMIYRDGLGVQKDYTEAKNWFHQAALAGNKDAQLEMGVLYHNGQGVPRNTKEALKWYKLSATQGVKLAHDNISTLITAGLATENDRPKMQLSGDHKVLPISAPSLAQMQSFYPVKALNEKTQGIAVVECVINIEGVATNCNVLSETPEGSDFGLATIRVLRTSTFSPAVSGGVVIESKYKQRIRWSYPKGLIQKLLGPVAEDTVICNDGSTEPYTSGGRFCSTRGGAKNVLLKSK